MKNLVITIMAIVFASSASADLDRWQMDPKCITVAIDYVQHPTVRKLNRDIIFASYSPRNIEKIYNNEDATFIGEIMVSFMKETNINSFKELSVLIANTVQPYIDDMMDSLEYSTVSALCNNYKEHEVSWMMSQLEDPMWVHILSKQANFQSDLMIEMSDELFKVNFELMQVMLSLGAD